MIADLVRTLDCAAVAIAGLLSLPVKLPADRMWDEGACILIAVLLVPRVFGVAGVYRSDSALCQASLPRAIAAFALLLLVVGLLATVAELQTRRALRVILWFAYGSAGLCILRYSLAWQVSHWRRDGRLQRNLLIVGSDDLAQRVARQIRRQQALGVRLVRVFADSVGDGAPWLRRSIDNEFARVVRDESVDQVVVALSWDAADRLSAWIRYLRDLPVDTLVYTPMPGRPLRDCHFSYLGDIPTLSVATQPLAGWGAIAKEVEDRVLAALLIILLAPIMMLAATAVRLSSPGPVLFRQKRHGFNNHVIEVLKFRTMYVETAQDGSGQVRQAKRDDPRITPVGRLLRRTSLDELPQLFNVLAGQMSLVGPRPHALAHNEQYARTINAYLGRHRVKPGITGWAQIKGLRGETDTIRKMAKRIACDLHYIEHWSIWVDIYIIIMTPLSVIINRDKAY